MIGAFGAFYVDWRILREIIWTLCNCNRRPSSDANIVNLVALQRGLSFSLHQLTRSAGFLEKFRESETEETNPVNFASVRRIFTLLKLADKMRRILKKNSSQIPEKTR